MKHTCHLKSFCNTVFDPQVPPNCIAISASICFQISVAVTVSLSAGAFNLLSHSNDLFIVVSFFESKAFATTIFCASISLCLKLLTFQVVKRFSV